MSAGERESAPGSSTARAAAALQAAIDDTHARFAVIERRAARNALHINDCRLGMARLLAETWEKALERLRRSRAQVRSAEAKRRAVNRRARRIIAGLRRRILAIRLWRLLLRLLRWMFFAFLIAAWAWMFWPEITGMVDLFLPRRPPAGQTPHPGDAP